ncbi:hypothetical protein [Parathermosynechococcus lividus]|nr:hypothetical protein [Synechococcus sp. PCC 6716]
MTYHKLWFQQTARQLQVLRPFPAFEIVQGFIHTYLPKLIDDMDGRGLDLTDPYHWWESIYIDGILELENSEGVTLSVAVGIIEQWRNANTALRMITTPRMVELRHSLNLEQHWLFYVSSRKPYPESVWIDLLYEQADKPPPESRCCIIEVVEPDL